MWKCTKCETLNKNEHHSCFICYNIEGSDPPWWKRFLVNLTKLTSQTGSPLWWKRFLPVVLAVVVIFVLGFISANVIPVPPEPEMVTVPDVVGLSLGDARQSLRVLGLEIHTRVEHDPSVAEGVVISQSIEDGTPVELGTRIELIISRGEPVPGMVEVPDLVGLSLTDARQLLEEMGLRVHTRDDHDSEIAEGAVISQSKREGTEVELGTRIDLIVSIGPPVPEMVTVNDVTGMSLTSARRQLEEDGFIVQVNRVYHPTILRNNVINQEPSADTRREQGTRIYLTISQGPDPNVLPFVLDVWSDTFQIEDRGVTIEVPMPAGNIRRQEEDAVVVATAQYSAGVRFRHTWASIEAGVASVLAFWPGLRTTDDYNFRDRGVYLEGSVLLVLELARDLDLDDTAEVDEGYILGRREVNVTIYTKIFEYQERIVYVVLIFDEHFPDADKIPFFEAYGFGKFIEAGYLL